MCHRGPFKFVLALGAILHVESTAAQNADALAEMARKAQDPLADVKAVMTDNTIAFEGGAE